MGYKDIIFEEKTIFLVTGGAGFIGSHLCEAILKMNYRVRCLDNFSTGKRRNIENLLSTSNFELVEGDVGDYNTCLSACENIDFVLHQAALGSVPESIEVPIRYEEVNVKGTLNMMEAAKQQKVKKFVYASSAAVYGNDEMLPKCEDNIGNPLSPYALTKHINEEYGKLYTDLYGLDTYGLRYFNVFGKRQNPNGMYASAIPKFVEQLLNNNQPVIYGDGTQSRDFVYVDDVIQANLKACKSSHEGVAGQVYNVAYGENKSLLDIYNYLCEALGKYIEPVYSNERNGDIKHSYADISKAKELLGYAPEFSFERGIREVIGWYKDNPENR